MLNVARRLLSAPPARQGVYHMAGQGETNWADLAREIFARSAAHGGPSALVEGIPAREYVTPAKRPANSRLDCSRLEKDFGITLPHWKEGVEDCVARLLKTGEFTMGGKEQ
jgi:dTDP-4-dehydrorhamnose reductase